MLTRLIKLIATTTNSNNSNTSNNNKNDNDNNNDDSNNSNNKIDSTNNSNWGCNEGSFYVSLVSPSLSGKPKHPINLFENNHVMLYQQIALTLFVSILYSSSLQISLKHIFDTPS